MNTRETPIAFAPQAASGAETVPAGLPPPHRLSLVVPMFNEAGNAQPLVDEVQSALAGYPYPWELIVVDDGSTDGTGAALERAAAAAGKHVRIVRLTRNFRQTAALQAGVDVARGDVIATMDGDLQNDPHDIPRMVAILLADDLDLVAGWRRERQDGFALRKLPSMLANKLIRRTTGLHFHDLGCSLKIFRADVLRQVRLYGEMHRFIPAWLATVTSPERMVETPVNHRPRVSGQSKYGLSRTFRVITDLLAMYFFLNFGSRPGHFFGGVGLMLGSAGGVMLMWLLWLKLHGVAIGSRPALSLAFFLVIAGLQFLIGGVVAELLIRIYYNRGEAAPYHRRPLKPLADGDGWSQSDGETSA